MDKKIRNSSAFPDLLHLLQFYSLGEIGQKYVFNGLINLGAYSEISSWVLGTIQFVLKFKLLLGFSIIPTYGIIEFYKVLVI